MNDRAYKDDRAALHTRHASSRSRGTPHVAHRLAIDPWLSRQLLAERAWTRRSVLGGLSGFTLSKWTADASTGGYAAELVVGIA